MATGREPARGSDDRHGVRGGAANAPQSVRRVILTGSVGDSVTRATAGSLEAQGVSVLIVDTSAEDPFVDVNGLLPDDDTSTADAVMTVGPPSATAMAIALLCDLPFIVAGVIDGRRLAAIGDALERGSAMHRSVLEVEIDGVRRLSLTDVEVTGCDKLVARASDLTGVRLVESERFGIGSERPQSGRLSIDHADGPVFSASAVAIESAPPGTRIALNGREQQFRRLMVRVHDKPLRELVLGSAGSRR